MLFCPTSLQATTNTGTGLVAASGPALGKELPANAATANTPSGATAAPITEKGYAVDDAPVPATATTTQTPVAAAAAPAAAPASAATTATPTTAAPAHKKKSKGGFFASCCGKSDHIE